MINKLISLYKNLFFIKIWNIGYINISKRFFLELSDLSFIEKNFIALNLSKKNYIFYADPFPLSKKFILAEAMNYQNIGELVLINITKNKVEKKYNNFKGHISFPSTFNENKHVYLLPEISHWSNQKLFKYSLKKNIIKSGKKLIGKNIDRLKDPIIYKKNKKYYLFFSKKNSKKIKIYFSKKLYGNYKEVNNISNDNSGFRMGGHIIKIKNEEFRISQNNSDLYGNGIKINKIKKLDPNSYKEELWKTLKFNNFYGPHTISFSRNFLFFDYYFLKFDFFAFFKKLKSKIIS